MLMSFCVVPPGMKLFETFATAYYSALE